MRWGFFFPFLSLNESVFFFKADGPLPGRPGVIIGGYASISIEDGMQVARLVCSAAQLSHKEKHILLVLDSSKIFNATELCFKACSRMVDIFNACYENTSGHNQRRFNLNLIIAKKSWSISYNTVFISVSDTIMQQTSAALLGICNCCHPRFSHTDVFMQASPSKAPYTVGEFSHLFWSAYPG